MLVLFFLIFIKKVNFKIMAYLQGVLSIVVLVLDDNTYAIQIEYMSTTDDRTIRTIEIPGSRLNEYWFQ